MRQIIFHKETKTFHLYNEKISYILCVLENGHLGQLYFGKRLHDKADFSYLVEKCGPVNCTADQLTVAAGCSQMLELVRQAKQSVVPADAPVELRLAASQTTLTDHDTGAAAEFFYGLVRSAEAAS